MMYWCTDPVIIRHQQLETMAAVSEQGYVACAVAHLERYDPPLASAAGRPGLEKLARKGLIAARQHGFVQDRTLQLYLELMMSLGCGFYTDPLFRWLDPYLDSKSGMGEVERARLLHFHVSAYLDRAYGERREHGQAVLERAATLTPERLHQAGANLDGKALTFVEWLHPQRMDFIDSEAVQTLIGGARKDAAAAGLQAPDAAALFFLLKFVFGHMILSDPLYPWIQPQLLDAGSGDASLRMERLMERSRAYLTAMQRYLGTVAS
jgi:hypothetical protein